MSSAPSAIQSQTLHRPQRLSLRAQAWQRFSRNRLSLLGALWIVIIAIVAIIGPMVAPHSYATTDYMSANSPPSWHYLFGTDNLGHDVFSEVLYSIRFACIIAVGATAISFFIGAVLGLWAGMKGGITDNIIMRLVDLMFAFPSYFLNLILVVDLGRGLFPIFLSIGVTQWAGYARLVRGLVLTVKDGEMAEAARSLGAKPAYIARYYLMPNILGSIIVSLSFGMPYAMTQDAALSVVGMGLRPPMPSFGNLLNAGTGAILGYPWLLYFPSAVFGLTLLAFLFVGDGLQDALNPKGAL